MNRSVRALAGLVTGLLLALSACADGSAPTDTLAPQVAASASTTTSNGGPDLSHLARFGKKPNITIAWAMKWIGPEGGRLDFHGFAIEVPAGAVDRVTRFSIRLPVDPQGAEHVVAEFAPHGATFAVPVTIEFPLANTSIAGNPAAHVVWWDGDQWVDVGGFPTADGSRLRARTDHFSTFGTTDEVSIAGAGVSGAGG